MRSNDRKRFSEILFGLCDTYNKTATDGMVALYWSTLQDMTIEEFERAAFIHVRRTDKESQFMPKPGALLAMVRGEPVDVAGLAWLKALNAVRRVGCYDSVAFDDAIIHAVIEALGGWPDFGRMETDKLPFYEQRFCKNYLALLRSGQPFEYPPYLVGIFEADNRSKGYPSQPPVLIGDREKARRVMAGGKQQPKQLAGSTGASVAKALQKGWAIKGME